jgi:hypothetical protein
MNELWIKAIVAGLCFGMWPLMMNKGGLSGNVASFVFAVVAAIFILPFAVGSLGGLAQARWSLVIGAASIGAVGLLSFVGMLTKATPASVSSLFVMMTIVQISCPVAYQIFVSGGMTATKGVGFGFAIVAAILLSL